MIVDGEKEVSMFRMVTLVLGSALLAFGIVSIVSGSQLREIVVYVVLGMAVMAAGITHHKPHPPQ